MPCALGNPQSNKLMLKKKNNNFAVFTYESNIFHKNGRFLGKLDYLYFFRGPST